MTNIYNHAQIELEILSKAATDPEDRPIIEEFKEEILALCEKFGSSGQSGGSAPYVATALGNSIKKLCLFESLSPITGIDDEWVNVSNYDAQGHEWYQNKRCMALFKDGKDGKAYYLDAIVWKGDTEGESGNNWDNFSGTVENIQSRQYIKGFPFTPKTFYIDVSREVLPIDWTEEPFYEDKTFDTNIFHETGEKIWSTEKYRYIIKDLNQLKRVENYYDFKYE